MEEDEQSHGLNGGNKNLFAAPEEDVSSTKNRTSSSDNQRKVGNTENAVASLQSTETAKKGDSPPFLGLATCGENLSASSYGDITSPQAMSMEPMRSDTENSQEASFVEQGQLVIAGIFCLVKHPQPKPRPPALLYPTEETMEHDISRAAKQSTKLIGSGGPYLNKDGTFKHYGSYQSLEPGAIIYAATESIYKVKKGDLLGLKLHVFKSKCGNFILKKIRYCKKLMDDWKQLPYCNNVLALSGVLMDDSDYIYQVTERMHYDLRQARNGITLIQLASTQTNEEWQYTIGNFKQIVRSILKGTIHLNNNKYQHYDLKEENIFVNRPAECQCNSILECTCAKQWDIKIGDFDTMSTMERPLTGICGTRYYHPPEYEGLNYYDVRYERPSYDSWSILIIILHFCCGTARSKSEQQARNLPWLQTQQECHYAYDRFRVLCKESTTYNSQLSLLVRFTTECLEINYRTRPTPKEMLQMWDTLCA